MSELKDHVQQFLQFVSLSPLLAALTSRSGAHLSSPARRWMDLNRRVLFVPAYDGTSSGYQNNNRG